MANIQNLVRGEEAHKFTAEEHSKGGKASAEARRRKRDLRNALEILLEKDIETANGNVVSGAEAITARLFREALSGNVKAFEVLRDTVGQKPAENVNIAVADFDALDRAFERLSDGENDD